MITNIRRIFLGFILVQLCSLSSAFADHRLLNQARDLANRVAEHLRAMELNPGAPGHGEKSQQLLNELANMRVSDDENERTRDERAQAKLDSATDSAWTLSFVFGHLNRVADEYISDFIFWGDDLVPSFFFSGVNELAQKAFLKQLRNQGFKFSKKFPNAMEELRTRMIPKVVSGAVADASCRPPLEKTGNPPPPPAQ